MVFIRLKNSTICLNGNHSNGQSRPPTTPPNGLHCRRPAADKVNLLRPETPRERNWDAKGLIIKWTFVSPVVILQAHWTVSDFPTARADQLPPLVAVSHRARRYREVCRCLGSRRVTQRTKKFFRSVTRRTRTSAAALVRKGSAAATFVMGMQNTAVKASVPVLETPMTVPTIATSWWKLTLYAASVAVDARARRSAAAGCRREWRRCRERLTCCALEDSVEQHGLDAHQRGDGDERHKYGNHDESPDCLELHAACVALSG